jgi:16S rRNA processing protein RimM
MSTSSTTDATPQGLLHVGRIGRAHGVKGELYVSLFSGHPLRVAAGARWMVRNEWLEVDRCKPQGDRWLVSFRQVTDRDAAEMLVNREVYAEPIDDPNVVWVHELIGAEVFDKDGTGCGKCSAVIDNPAHPIMELESGALVPTVFIVSREPGRVVIDAPEGLFDDAD